MKKTTLFFSVFLLIVSYVYSQQLTQNNFTGILVPRYICSGTNTRLPYVFRAQLTNLQPNTKYRYYTQVCRFTDLGSTNSGAGNPVMINGGNFKYTTNPGLSNPAGYDSLITNASGTYTGWFGFVHTGNARFTAGNYVIPAITLDSGGSGSVRHRFALNDSILVLGFSTDSALSTAATGIYGISLASPKDIVSLYDNVNNTGRPLAMVYLENEGIDSSAMASLVVYYRDSVNFKNGRWGSFLPNQLPGGLRRINVHDIITGNITASNTDEDGIWQSGTNTINPHGSYTNAVRMSAQDAPLLIKINETEVPGNFSLKQNFPNPFNSVTNIEFSLPKSGYTSLKLFDVLGRDVIKIINEFLSQGSYRVKIDGSSLCSGVYYYSLSFITQEGKDYTSVKKAVLLK